MNLSRISQPNNMNSSGPKAADNERSMSRVSLPLFPPTWSYYPGIKKPAVVGLAFQDRDVVYLLTNFLIFVNLGLCREPHDLI
jgi:hypothetical protein